MIAHTIRQALDSNLFEEVAVSSDSDVILEAGRDWGASCLVKRPTELASDEASKIPAIIHCVRTAEESTGQTFETIADLDATTPLRITEDIRGAVALLEDGMADNVVSGTPSRRSPYFNIVERNNAGGVHLSKRPDMPVERRQDVPLSYDLNGSVYVWRRQALFSNGNNFLGEKSRLFLMAQERSLDIDSELDFQIIEFLMERLKVIQVTR